MPDLPKRLPTGHVLKLPRLSQPAIEELSAAILGPAGRRTDVVDLLERETEGNVFFLVEVLRALAENAGRLDDVGAMTLPASVFTGGVRRIVQRRLSKVPPRAYPLLKQAAVAGRQLDLRLLGEIAPAVDLDEWLTLCVNAVVVENYDGRWRFAHDKLREFLLEEISPPERATLHRAAAEALENTYADDLDRFAPALAHHWAEAGDTRKAGGYAVLAAQQALESSAYAEARRQFEAALEMRGHEAFENPVERLAALHHELGTALYNLNEYDQAREHHQTSLAMYRAIEHRTGISNALSGLGEVDFRVGLLDQAEAEFQEALDICEELQLTREIGYGYLNLGVVAVYRAEWLRARDLFRQALEYMEQVGSPRDLARALNNYAGTLDELGEKEPARALHYRALEIRERIRDLYGVASSLVNLAVLEETVGNIDVAFATYQRARELGLQLSNRRIEAYAVHGLGSIAFNRHQYDSARAYFQRSLELRSQINEPAGAIETIVFLGDVERESGNDRQALAYYQQALALSAQHDLLATGIAALHHLAVWLQAQHRPLAALTLMVFVSSQRSYPHQEDQTLMDELRAALPHAGVEQALRLGERLTFAQVAAAVASGSLDFGDELPA
jgi:tetratricopeptide (TPR) repeat protein